MSDELPEAGHSEEPTTDMILRGKVGNGTWQKLNSEMSVQIQKERAIAKREAAAGRQEAYEQGAKDMLEKIGKFEKNLLEIGAELAEQKQRGTALTKDEVATMKLAQSVAVEVKNRGIGKSTTKHEITNQTSILHLIAGLGNDGQ